MGVSALLGIIIVTISAWVEIIAHLHMVLDAWYVLGLAPLFVANDIVLVGRGAGPEFERQFRAFGKSKRITLYTVAILVVVGSVATLLLLLSEYRHTVVSRRVV